MCISSNQKQSIFQEAGCKDPSRPQLVPVQVVVTLVESLSNDDGNAKENVIEIVYFGPFILLRDYFNSFNLYNVAKLSGS